jgi:hypothetical protein
VVPGKVTVVDVEELASQLIKKEEIVLSWIFCAPKRKTTHPERDRWMISITRNDEVPVFRLGEAESIRIKDLIEN